MTKEELKQEIINECRELFEKAKEMEYIKTEPNDNDLFTNWLENTSIVLDKK